MTRLEGAANFRDLGGYPAAEGKTVRHGRIFRSGHLGALTPRDLEALSCLKVAHVFDLRSDQERQDANVAWSGHAIEFHCIPMGNAQMKEGLAPFLKRLMLMSEAEARELMRELMEDMALNEAGQLGELFARIAAGRTPAIIHCTAGKDRTGLASALLLSLLGVPREFVIEDYLKTNAVTPGNLPAALRLLRGEVTGVLMGVDRGYLEAAFTAIEVRHGSWDQYREKGLGLSGEQVAALRDLLLG